MAAAVPTRMEPGEIVDMLKHHRLGTQKHGFKLFEPVVYTSPEKMRCLLTAYAGLAISKQETMKLATLQYKSFHHYQRFVNKFLLGYGNWKQLYLHRKWLLMFFLYIAQARRRIVPKIYCTARTLQKRRTGLMEKKSGKSSRFVCIVCIDCLLIGCIDCMHCTDDANYIQQHIHPLSAPNFDRQGVHTPVRQILGGHGRAI